jgi:hypothetical protein
MTEEKERRALNRINAPSAELFYKPIKYLNILSSLNGPTDLVNISKSGACFRAKNALARGSDILLKIRMPRQVPIIIKANTVWVSAEHDRNNPSVGVQFRPFGKGKKYNSFESKEALDQALTRFTKLT